MLICASCGLIAPKTLKTCECCQASLDAAREAEGASGEAAWVSVRCTFECRACGRRAPLDHLDADGVVFCALCGTEQAFAAKSWRGLLEAARDIGDLAWPKSEGRHPHATLQVARENPYHDIGVVHASREWSQGQSETSNPLHAILGPGHPLCQTCREPLSVTGEGDTAKASCAKCSQEMLYSVPAPARAMNVGLVAVLAEDHRKEHAPARVQHDSGTAAVAVTCPSCGAALKPDPKTPLLTCAYCNTVSRVPARAFYGITGAEPKVEPFWLLLSGESAARRTILEKLRAAERRAERAERALPLPPDERPERDGSKKDRALITRGKRLTALWFLTSVPASIFVGLTLLKYDARFGLPLLRPVGIPIAVVVLLGLVWGPWLFFGMPSGKGDDKAWNAQPESNYRWGIVALGVVFVITAVTSIACVPSLLEPPPPPPKHAPAHR